MEIARRESAATTTAGVAGTEGIKKESKCPFVQNGAGPHESADTSGTDTNAESSESNSVALAEASTTNDKPVGLGSFKMAKIETVKENLEAQSLNVQQINDYCKSLFIFKNIRVMRFK